MKPVLRFFTFGIFLLLFSCGKAEYHPDLDGVSVLTFHRVAEGEPIDTGELLKGVELTGPSTLSPGQEFSVRFIGREKWIGDYWTAWFAIQDSQREIFREFWSQSPRPEMVVKINDGYFSATAIDQQQTAVDHLGNKVAINESIGGMLIGIMQRKN